MTPSRQLHGHLGSGDKVFVNVACASHFMLWERQHEVLHRLSAEWLRHGSLRGVSEGVFSVDAEGELHGPE